MADSWVNVTAHGVTAGNSAATNTANLNALIASIKSATSDATVFFPAGTYNFDGVITISDATATEDSLRRVSLRGDGPGATQLNYTGSDRFLTYEGPGYLTNTAGPDYGYFSFEKLRLQRDTSAGFSSSSAGVALICAGFIALRDVVVSGWGNGLYVQDSYNILVENCTIFGNLTGVFAQGIFTASQAGYSTNPSNPDSITFLNCAFANNAWAAVTLIDSGACDFIGGSINDNGQNTVVPISPNPTYGVGILNGNDTSAMIVNASSSPWGASFEGVLFQDNFGYADVYLKGGSPFSAGQDFIVSGSVTIGDSLSVTATSAAIGGSPVEVGYTVRAGDTITSATAGLFAALQANAALSAAGVVVTNPSPSVILAFVPVGIAVAWSVAVAGAGTETIATGPLALEGPSGLLVKGCGFSRTLNAGAANCVRMDVGTSGSGWPTSLVLIGNGFSHYGIGYTPSAAKPYVAVGANGAPYQVTEWGNLYADDVERPSFQGPVQGPKALASAWATFDGVTAAISQGFNVASVTRNGAGNYTLTFQRALMFRQNTDSTANTDYAVTGGLNGIGFFVVSNRTAASLTIATCDGSGTAADFTDISVACHGGNSLI
jgi:hypothetical protein